MNFRRFSAVGGWGWGVVNLAWTMDQGEERGGEGRRGEESVGTLSWVRLGEVVCVHSVWQIG